MANRLLLEATGASGSARIIARFDDRATVEDLVYALEPIVGSLDHGRATTLVIQGKEALDPSNRLVESPVRSGDAIALRSLDVRSIGSGSEAPATARVRDGSGAERVVPLHYGQNTVGRDESCEVVVDDPLASRRHVRITVGDVVTVSDLGSTNGSTVGDTRLAGEFEIGPNDAVGVGDAVITVVRATPPRFSSALVANHYRFNRPPRVVPPYEGQDFAVPAPPSEPPASRFPVIAAVIPAVLAVGLWMFTGNVASLAFLALSPVMMAGRYFERRRGACADHEAAVEHWRRTVADLIDRMQVAADEEIRRRNGEARPYEDSRAAVVRADPGAVGAWTRRRGLPRRTPGLRCPSVAFDGDSR